MDSKVAYRNWSVNVFNYKGEVHNTTSEYYYTICLKDLSFYLLDTYDGNCTREFQCHGRTYEFELSPWYWIGEGIGVGRIIKLWIINTATPFITGKYIVFSRALRLNTNEVTSEYAKTLAHIIETELTEYLKSIERTDMGKIKYPYCADCSKWINE